MVFFLLHYLGGRREAASSLFGMDFAYDMAKGNNFHSKGVFMINPLFSVPTVNLFGVDPFDHGESNVANGFTQLVNDRLVPNRKRSTSRPYIVTLLI